MPVRVHAILAALLLGLASGSARAENTSAVDSAQPHWLPSTMELQRMLKAHDVPGVALVGIKDCKPMAARNAGHAEMTPARPVGVATAFESASLSKPVFAYLVLALADEGLLDLDEPVAKTLAFPRIQDTARYALITPRLVLSHRTGLPNWAGDPTRANRRDPLHFVSEPGTSYSYSGEAFELLRAFVEAKTGRSLNALFRERLGALMPHSTFARPLPAAAQAAKGYFRASEPRSGREMTNLSDGSFGAAGGLASTASDYAAFLGRVCEGSGLSKKAYDAMLTPLTPLPDGSFPAPAAYGLGWALMQAGNDTIVMHNGSNDEFRSFAAFNRSTREGIVVLTNGRFGGDLIDEIMQGMQ